MSFPVNADDLRAALGEILTKRELLARTSGSAACCEETTHQTEAMDYGSCSRQDLSTASPVFRGGIARRLFAPRNSFASCHFAKVSVPTPDLTDADILDSGDDSLETPTADGTVPCYPFEDPALGSDDGGDEEEEAENELLDLEEFMAAQLCADGDGGCAADDDDVDGGECHLESCTCSRSRSKTSLKASRNSSVSETEPRDTDARDVAEGGATSSHVARDDSMGDDSCDEIARREFGQASSLRSTLSCRSWDELELTCADLDAQNVQILELDLTLMLRRPVDADVRCDLLTVEFLAPSAAAAMATAF
ncbi:hypothetical protein CLOP_g20229 [Closterium sp. NIES-67]|nr:hypothetical protein CLOP_g20229 [Closterium sp. NIES-67]